MARVVEKTLLLVTQTSAIVSIHKQRICKNYTVYLAFDLYYVRSSLMMYTVLQENCGTVCFFFFILFFLINWGNKILFVI